MTGRDCLRSLSARVSRACVRITERQALLDEICCAAVEEGGFRLAWFGFVDEASGLIRPTAHRGVEDGYLASVRIRLTPPEECGQTAAALRQLRCSVNNDIGAAACEPWYAEAVRRGHHSLAVFPVAAQSRLIGSFALYASEPGAFPEDAAEVLSAVAADCGYALERIREAHTRESENGRGKLDPAPHSIRAQARVNARLRLLLEAAPDAIIEIGPDGRILLLNAAAERIFGYTRGELLDQPVELLLPHRFRARHVIQRTEYFTHPEARAVAPGHDTLARRRNGTEFPVEISLSPIEFEDGPVVTCIVRDITARKQAESALRDSNRRLSSVLESITDVFFALDRDWRLTYVNGRGEQLFGRQRQDLQGKMLSEAFPELAGTVFDEQFHRAAVERQPVEFTAYYAPLKLWADVHVYPSGEGLSVYLQDVSARKALEERLSQSQRLEALGRLAGGVAHDFNNLLTIIGGYGQMVLDTLETVHPLRKDIEPIVEAANRASALTRQLLAFSRRQSVQPKVIDINRLIAKMNKMLRRVIAEDIDLGLSLKPDVGRVKADPGQLEQVLMNLAVNARDAMPTGGKLTISTENSDGAMIAPASEGGYVLLSVTDTGTGMDEHTRQHLFEPFFTTKGKGKGTGLGLSTVYGIVKQSAGEIWVDSEPGRGSCFRLYFPRANKTPKRVRLNTKRMRLRRGTETVLLVEDDVDVRKLASGMLSRLGYKVLEAAGGADALALWQERSGPVDLLVTDIIMPQMSGPELAGRLTAIRRDLKVLFISGYTDEIIAQHGLVENQAEVLHKPFTHEALGLKVRSILDSSAPTHSVR